MRQPFNAAGALAQVGSGRRVLIQNRLSNHGSPLRSHTSEYLNRGLPARLRQADRLATVCARIGAKACIGKVHIGTFAMDGWVDVEVEC